MTDKRKVLVLIIWVLLGVAYVLIWSQAKRSCCNTLENSLSWKESELIVPVTNYFGKRTSVPLNRK